MRTFLLVCLMAGAASAAPELLFHASFDGTADATFAKGAAKPKSAGSISFAEGRRGKAVRFVRKGNSCLKYEAEGNIASERGAVAFWYRRSWPIGPAGDSVFGEDWHHVSVTWNGKDVQLYVNGRLERNAGKDALAAKNALMPQDGAIAFNADTFTVFGCNARGALSESLLDDLRIYSEPLTPEQIYELYRRETVLEIKAAGTWAVAGSTFDVEVKASSPADCDISGLRWCICDASGKVVSKWDKSITDITREKRLKVLLQAGEYRLRATDGTWFYGDVPIRVMPRENRHARAVVAVHEPADPKPESGPKRFWRDMRRGEFSQAEELSTTPRRIVARFCDSYPEKVEDLPDLIDRTAAHMKSAGENALACPAEWFGMPNFLSAWYAKFEVEGLVLFPTVDLGKELPADKSAMRELQRRVDRLVDAGMRHGSFGGICIHVPRHEMLSAEDRKRLGHALSGRRTLWVVDDADLADFTRPIRAGDSVALAARGDFANVSAPGSRVPFIQSFRTLPAVKFDDLKGAAGSIRVRHATYNGASWFYVFNAGSVPTRVKMELPARTRDLAKDERVGDLFGTSVRDITLLPGDFRAFSSPEGLPTVLR